MTRSFILRFLKKEKIAKDTYSFHFDKKNQKFDFSPGEYIKMFLDIKNPDSRGSSRYFTIASSPLDKDFLTITTRVIKSSFKKKLLGLKKGEEIRFFGPMGNFVIDKKDKRLKVFLAGGIGMTTFYSMIKYSHQSKIKDKIILITSFSDLSTMVFKEELENVSKENLNIKVVYITQRINQNIIEKFIPKNSEALFYVVGPAQMVEDTKHVLLKMKIKEENINLEDFTGY